MQLTVNGDLISLAADADLVSQSLDNLAAEVRDEFTFVILHNSEVSHYHFIQTGVQSSSKDEEGHIIFVVEVREGDGDYYFESSVAGPLALEIVKRVFISYLNSENDWKNLIPWEKLSYDSLEYLGTEEKKLMFDDGTAGVPLTELVEVIVLQWRCPKCRHRNIVTNWQVGDPPVRRDQSDRCTNCYLEIEFTE